MLSAIETIVKFNKVNKLYKSPSFSAYSIRRATVWTCFHLSFLSSLVRVLKVKIKNVLYVKK